jgi:hypothetical protein
MVPLSNSAASDNPEFSASSTGTAADGGWRAWWQAEASRQGSDWPSIITAHLTIVDQLRDADDADVRMASS